MARTGARSVAQLKYWTWQCATKVGFGVVYVAVIAKGFREMVPALGMKLYQIPLPLFGLLKRFEATHRLDIAPILSAFLCFFVLFLWERIIAKWLTRGQPKEGHWDDDSHWFLMKTMGVVLLGADALLFFVAITRSGWSRTTFSFTALLATAAYTALLVCVSYVTIELRQNLRHLEEEK